MSESLSPQTDTTNQDTKKWTNVHVQKGRLLFYVLTLAALLLIYKQFDEVKSIQEAFLRANYLWLLAAAASQLLQYPFLALNYQSVLRIKHTNAPLRELLPMTFIVQFFNQVLPSANVSGQGFFIYYLKKKYNMRVDEGIGRVILELSTALFGNWFFHFAFV